MLFKLTHFNNRIYPAVIFITGILFFTNTYANSKNSNSGITTDASSTTVEPGAVGKQMANRPVNILSEQNNSPLIVQKKSSNKNITKINIKKKKYKKSKNQTLHQAKSTPKNNN